MGSTIYWSNHWVGAGAQTVSWSVPAGCTADSLYVKREGGSASVYLYWRNGQWKLSGTQSSTYAVSGTSGSETFFAGGTSGGSCTATVILYYHTVEAASTINASNITFPNDINNRSVSSTVTISNSTMNMNEIHHVITWTCGAFTGSVTTSNGATSASYNIYDACAQFPTGSSANMTITCTTYKNSNQIGSPTSKTITLSLPQINPLLTGDVAVQANQWNGRNLAGQTTIRFSGTCTPAFHSTTPVIHIVGGGVDVYVPNNQITLQSGTETYDWYVDAISSLYGSFTFTILCQCSRGWASNITAGNSSGGQYQPTTITFVPYTPPTISASCYRCNRAGNTQANGTFIACRIHFDYTIFNDTITPNNTASVEFFYASSTATDWTAWNPSVTTVINDSTTVLRLTTPDVSETDETADGGFYPDRQYKIRAVITDALNNSAAAASSIGTAEVFMRWDHGHNAFGFGAYPFADNSVYLSPSWTFHTHGQEIIDLIHPIGSIYISINNTSPATLFPGTYWRRISGRYLIAAGAPNANDDNSIGSITGGWNAIVGTKAGGDAHSHATQNHTLTISEIPQHYHGMLDWWNTSYSGSGTRAAVAVNGDGSGSADVRNNRSRSDGVIQSASNMTVRTGTAIGQPHNHGATETGWNLPPYFAVNMWLRVATAEEAATDI